MSNGSTAITSHLSKVIRVRLLNEKSKSQRNTKKIIVPVKGRIINTDKPN
jgi:hypothetical protein